MKEGFKRLVSLPEEILNNYKKIPLISNLYLRKIGFFPHPIFGTSEEPVYFSRIVTKRMGMSPTEYRKRNR